MKKVTIILMVVAGLFLSIPHVQAKDPILIGYIGMQSGPGKAMSDSFILGINVASKEINKNGGILGHPIQLLVEDMQMKPEIALQKLKKLMLKDKVEAVFGGGTSAGALAISKTMRRYKKIFMPTAPTIDITGKHFNPYVFRANNNIPMVVMAMAQYIGKQTSLRKVYMINQDYSYGHDNAAYWEKFIKKYAPDTEIVGNDFHPMFNKDFASYISKIKASGADYIFTNNWGPDLARLIIQGLSFGMKLPFVGMVVGDSTILKSLPGDQAMGSFCAGSIFPGIGTPEFSKFEDSFFKTSGGVWPDSPYWGYQIMKMYAAAVNQAKSLDINKIIKAFEGMKWEGPTGVVTMRAKDHQAIMPMFIGQVVKKTKYYDFPYPKPIKMIPAKEFDYKPENFGWKPYKAK